MQVSPPGFRSFDRETRPQVSPRMISKSRSCPSLADEKSLHLLHFEALGNKCTLKFRLEDQREAAEFSNEVLTWIRAFDARFSRVHPDSIISRVNAAAGYGWTPVDWEMDRLLDIADDFHVRTQGILDPTLLPLIRIWDWRSIRLALPEAMAIKEALELTGWETVERRPGLVRLPKVGMGLDFGYFAKEYAVDHLARIANRRGIANALIDLGRDIFALGGNGMHAFWHIGIEDGVTPGTCRGGLAVSDLGVSTSGDFTRYFTHDGVRYGHILDPRTGWPVRNGLRAATVIAPSCIQAGMYSTAANILGRSEGLRLASLARDVDICVQDESGIESSPCFDRFFFQAVGEIPSHAPFGTGPNRIMRELALLTR